MLWNISIKGEFHLGKIKCLVVEGRSRSDFEDQINYQLEKLHNEDEILTIDVKKERDKYLAVIIYRKA
jgi:hypothetical protein